MSKNCDTLVFIALGSNLGDKLKQLDTAVLELSKHDKITCVAMSRVYISKPHGPQNQPDFFNAAVKLYTSLSAEYLLDVLQQIENKFGRDRNVHWGPRPVDLDIILFGQEIINTSRLTVPHPLAYEREFVLQPLIDLDKNLVIANRGNVIQLLQKLSTKNMEIIRNVTTYYN